LPACGLLAVVIIGRAGRELAQRGSVVLLPPWGCSSG